MQTPSLDGNLAALRNLLQSREPNPTAQWEQNLQELCSVISSHTRGSMRRRHRQSNAQKKTDVADPVADADKFLSKLTLCTGLAGFFRLINRDDAAKVEVIECFSSILGQFPPLGLAGLRDEAQLEGLTRAQEYLTESVQQDSVAKSACIDALIGLSISRGSLAANVGVCKLLLKCPHLVEKRHVERFQTIAETSTHWFVDRSIEAVWTKQVLPVLRTVLGDQRSSPSDQGGSNGALGTVDQKWQEVLPLLKQGKSALATTMITEMLGGKPLPASFSFPPNDDVSPASNNNSNDNDNKNSTTSFVSPLLSRLADGGVCAGSEAAAAFVTPLASLAARLELPPVLDAARVEAPPEHVAGSLDDVAALCDLLESVYTHQLQPTAASPGEEMAALQPVTGENGAEGAEGVLGVIVASLLRILLVNIQFHAAARKQGLHASGNGDAHTHTTRIEAALRRLLLEQAGFATIGEKGHALAAECYSEGLSLFFGDAGPLLLALRPLLEDIQQAQEQEAQGEDAARAPKHLAAIILSHLSRREALQGLLVAPDEADSTETGEGEQNKLGQQEGRWKGMGELMQALLDCLFKELEGLVASGTMFRAEARIAHKVEAEVLEWTWERISRNFDSEDKLAVRNTRGRVGMAVGEKCLKSGKHLWQIRVGDTGNGEMWVGVTPTNINVDCGTGSNMTLWMPDGTVKSPQQPDAIIEGYSGGDVLSLVLDMDDSGGKITFYKNDLPVGDVRVVKRGTAEPYPCIILKDSCQSITLLRSTSLASDVDWLPNNSSPAVEDNFAVACASVWAQAVLVLHAELASDPKRTQLQELAAHLLDLVFTRFTQYLSNTLNPSSSILALLSTLDHLPGTTSVGRRHLLTWLPSTLALASRIDLALCDPVARAMPVLSCIKAIRSLVTAHSEFSSYSGHCFRSFKLKGLSFGRPKLSAAVAHPGISGDWTVEVIFKRGRLLVQAESEASVLLGAESFALEVDRVSGALGIVDFQALGAEAGSKTSLPGSFPLEDWALATLVCSDGMMTLYKDGALLGSVSKALPLCLKTVGACSVRDKGTHYLTGAVRRVRVWSKALSTAEVEHHASVGTLPAASDSGFVFTLDLRGGRTNTVQMHSSLGGCSAVLEGCASSLGEYDGDEPHWLLDMLEMLTGMLSRLSISMVRGQKQDQDDEEAAAVMQQALFAGGLDEEPAHATLLQAKMPEAIKDSIGVLLMPAVGVRSSLHLDALERAVTLALLHHCGLVPRIVDADPTRARSAQIDATCTSAARAARAIRDHVGQERDLRIRQLAPDAEPPSWEEVCAPFVNKCRLLLRVPPMCEVVGADGDSTSEALTDSQHALSVHRQVWRQSVGDSQEKRAMEQVSQFLRQGPEAAAAAQALKSRTSHALEVQSGLQMLHDLLAMQPLLRLRASTLDVMATTGRADRHYLSSIPGIGGAVAGQVRGAFGALTKQLVSIVGQQPINGEAMRGAAEALLVAVDVQDMRQLLQTRLTDQIREYWSDPWQHSVDPAVMRSMMRLTVGLLLQQGLHSREMEDAETARVLSCGCAALQFLSASSLQAAMDQLESLRYVGVRVTKLASSPEDGEHLAFTLWPAKGCLSAWRRVVGSADYQGREYAVEGLLRETSPETKLMCLSLTCKPPSAGRPVSIAGVVEDGVLKGKWKVEGDHAEKDAPGCRCLQDGVPVGFFATKNVVDGGNVSSPTVLGGFLTWKGGDPVATTYAKRPVTPSNNTIEVRIARGPKDKVELAVGLVRDQYSHLAYPGWEAGSIAYHADNAEVYLDRVACAVGKTASVGDVIGCSVEFSPVGSLSRVLWSLNGSVIASVDVQGKLPDRMFFALGGHMLGSKPLYVAVMQGGVQKTDSEKQRRAEEVQSLERVLQCVSQIGHHKAVRTLLQHQTWVSLLWSLLASPRHSFAARSHALGILALSLLEPGAVHQAELQPFIHRLLQAVALLSPESHVCGLQLDEETAPDLALRSQVMALMKRLASMQHVQTELKQVALEHLRGLRDGNAREAVQMESLSAVLVLGGVMDEVCGDQEGGQRAQSRSGGLLLDAEIIEEAVLALHAALQPAVLSGRGLLVARVLRTRLLKLVWEAARQQPETVDTVLASRTELLQELVALAKQRWRVPLSPLAHGAVVTSPPKFRETGVGGKKIQNVAVSSGGSACKITGERTVAVAGEMRPGTGTYYVEYVIESTRNYGTIGLGVADYIKYESFAKVGYKGASNDDDFKDEGNWEKDNLTRTGSFGFGPQDAVGVQLDTDEMRLSFTKNGKLVATYVHSLPRRNFVFMVSASSTFALHIARNPKYAALRTVGPAAAANPSAQSSWTTMEILIAKSHALSLELADAPGELTTSDSQAQFQAEQHPVRMYSREMRSRVRAWVESSEYKLTSGQERADTLELLGEMKGAKSGTEQSDDETQKASPWRSCGDPAQLLVDTEDALSVGLARVMVSDLLARNHTATASLLDARGLLDLVSPHFPPSMDSLSVRALFSSGPYADVISVLDRTVRGWLHARRSCDSEMLGDDVEEMAKECRESLEGVLTARMLQSQGTVELCLPFSRLSLSGPSSVSWYQPRRLNLNKSQPETEREMLAGASLSLALWLAPHVCHAQSLPGVRRQDIDVAGVLHALLEAGRGCAEPRQQQQLQRAVVSCLAHVDADAVTRLGAQAQAPLQLMHAEAVERMVLESAAGSTHPSGSGVFFSAGVQALAATIVTADLALSGGLDALGAVKALRTLSAPVKVEAKGPKHPPDVMGVVQQLLEMGFQERVIEAAMKEIGEVSSLEGERGMDILEWVSAHPDAGLDQEDDPGPQAASAAEEWSIKREPMTELALSSLESLMLVRQLLSCLSGHKVLPSWAVDRAKSQAITRAQFMSWDDRDSLGGVLVSDGCSRAVLRGSHGHGTWGYVRGNLPFDHCNTFLAVQIPKPKRGARWRRGEMKMGVACAQGDWTAEEREALRATGAVGASCVLWAMASRDVVVTGPDGSVSGGVATAPYSPGSVVGLYVQPKSRALSLYVASSPAEPFTKACTVTLPSAVGAIVPLVAIRSPALSARVVALAPPPDVVSPPTRLLVTERTSLIDGPLAFPGRNHLVAAGMDWEQALSPSWPPTTDALLVELAMQRAAAINKPPLALAVSDLFPPSPPGKPRAQAAQPQSVAAALEREPSRLPPAVRSISGLRAMPGAGQPPPAGLRSVRPAEAVTLPAVGVRLSAMSAEALRARFALLKVLNDALSSVLPLVDLQLFEHRHETAHLLARNKGVIFPALKSDLLHKTLHATQAPGSGSADVSVNRGTHTAERRRRERTVFVQLQTQLEAQALVAFADRRDGNKMAWQVQFVGEGGSDQGGLYRDSIREVAHELQCRAPGGLQLFVPCPNHKMASGANQDKWIPNPASTTPADLGSYRFLGKLMGACLRTNAPLEVDFASLVWKAVVGEESTAADVAALDDKFASEIEVLQGIASEAEWRSHAATWRARSFTGKALSLVPGGSRAPVAWHDRDLYVGALVRQRLAECAAQVQAMREGFLAVVPSRVLPLFTWRELQLKVCGVPIVAVDKLQRITVYENFSGGASHEVAKMFWAVVGAMTDEDRAALLAFAWGKRRLPEEKSGVHFTLLLAPGMDDSHLPLSHTCVFQLDLPPYSSADVMRDKLLYAIHCCTAIDNDNRAGGTLYASDDDDEAAAPDREEVGADEEQEDLAAGDVAVDGRGWLSVPLDGGHTLSRLSHAVNLPPPPEDGTAAKPDANKASGSAARREGSEQGERPGCALS